MNNKHIASILHHFADMLELSGESGFKVLAYRKAARAVENSRESLTTMQDITSLPGVGKGTASVIEEIIHTGRLQLLEEIQQSLPPELPNLLHLPGLGPKTIYTLYKELQITNRDELRLAAEQQKIRVLSGFGVKKEQKILEALLQEEQRPERIHLHYADWMSLQILSHLEKIEGVIRCERAGSLRRGKETIKDLDFVIATENPIHVAEHIVHIPSVKEVVNHGETKVSIVVEEGDLVVSVDVRLVPPSQFGSALHHFTGSKEHNVRIRQRAKQRNWKVSEYGILNTETEELMTFSEEQSFFERLDLPWIPPELREDHGEIEAAESGSLPQLIEKSHYRGDLHCHTLYSDGAHSILEMAQAAQQKGYEYVAITDHSRSLQVASGLQIEDIYQQWKEIDQVNKDLKGITILKGTEMDILADGSLDFPDELLAEMDIVIASIHTNFRQDAETMTRRIIRAMENPYVQIIAHPTGRLLLRREGYALHMEQILQAAKDTGTILELNANPHRLDLNDRIIHQAKEEYGLSFSINTDAHSVDGFHFIDYGISQARRGWLSKEDVINTLALADLKTKLKKGKV